MIPDRIRAWQLAHPERLREYNLRYRRSPKYKPKPQDPKRAKVYREHYTLNLISRYFSGETLSYHAIIRIKSRLNGTYKPHKRPPQP